MPKVVRSSGRRLLCTNDAHRRESINTGNMDLVAPRKVSFEQRHDSFQLLSEVTSSLSSSNSSTTMSPPRLLSSKSLLKRPRPSSCLAELAGVNNSSFISEDTNSLESPSSVFRFMDSPSSPWGHFVDLLVPTESDSDYESDAFHRKRLRTQELCGFSSRSFSYDPYPKLSRNRSGRFPIITATLKVDRRRCLKSEKRHFKSRGFLFPALASSSKKEGSNEMENAFRNLHM